MDRKNSITMVLACDHGAEIEALLRRQQELVTQLRVLVLPQLHGVDDGRSAELAVQLFDDVIGCNSSVVSKLFSTGGGPAVELSTTTSTGEMVEEQARSSSSVGQKRRRNDGKRSRSLVTNVPHYDGHQWRKYGQKNIKGRQHARSYYRCTYTERNCLATKTIQQQDQNGSITNYSEDSEEAAKYTVVYYGHHTCKGDSISDGTNNNDDIDLPQPVNMDLQSGEMARTATEILEPEAELDVAALLEVFNNSQLNWEIVC